MVHAWCDTVVFRSQDMLHQIPFEGPDMFTKIVNIILFGEFLPKEQKDQEIDSIDLSTKNIFTRGMESC